MIKIVAAMRRKPGMTHAECLQYIEHTHGQIARDKPLGLKKYIQNHVFDSAFGSDSDPAYVQTFHRDSVTELYFDDFAGVIQTFSDPYTQQKTGPDGRNFADLAKQAAQLMDESEVPVAKPGAAPTKVMHFIKKAPEAGLDEFFNGWSAAYEAAQKACPEFSLALRRHVRSHYLPEGDKVTAYFGPEIEVHHGLSSMWFESEADLAVFRPYQRLITEALVKEGLMDASGSFFVYAREVSILN
jgi:hypothetical protein